MSVDPKEDEIFMNAFRVKGKCTNGGGGLGVEITMCMLIIELQRELENAIQILRNGRL